MDYWKTESGLRTEPSYNKRHFRASTSQPKIISGNFQARRSLSEPTKPQHQARKQPQHARGQNKADSNFAIPNIHSNNPTKAEKERGNIEAPCHCSLNNHHITRRSTKVIGKQTHSPRFLPIYCELTAYALTAKPKSWPTDISYSFTTSG
jgi:hypothetical protein